ncbi:MULTISPECIES: flagellar export chaperone FliS [Oceanobacillus]|uniref:Flagellar secretion chaperone FliS n=1 Tax=Oceanobacillus kimchii TaxID=746691 RepID=A0ABQ5TN18_9BACI|nr:MULTISPECIES: flagellar export chaperone FliS [Oceanobacillus]MBT2600125.1 flagellar export chaperone FliS [Oceanobacillus sp. ISL-74]MBT2650283.1 flagellar export chaperone FliS [Oceanobacillus sp. ISL-73]MCT1578026.1 flagellar export chaperone FliS [Oceanobacillus kimchii]MCT2137586.1 flagellar export chaperone FliS [Oceanobacillus kimchii]OEH55162.1 flagellar protein FliS [Oceanobacillus sp. E9]
MVANKAYQTYQNNSVNTASSGELTLMLYNGCMKFIKQAKKDIQADNFAGKNKNIQKAQDIIHELMITLDSKIAISKQILPLYEYMQYQLKEANVHNDTSKLDEVLGFVTEFRDTWKQVIIKNRQQQYNEGASV